MALNLPPIGRNMSPMRLERAKMIAARVVDRAVENMTADQINDLVGEGADLANILTGEREDMADLILDRLCDSYFELVDQERALTGLPG